MVKKNYVPEVGFAAYEYHGWY